MQVDLIELKTNRVVPFLKWAGGKRQLLAELLKCLPPKFNVYHEPFLGGGALFYALETRKLFKRAYISDLNSDLINAYTIVRDEVENLIASLQRHIYDAEYYYNIRGENLVDPIERASRFIYLNKTCFNGLYRVNSSGLFNVPFGSYSNPAICNEENLKSCESSLRNATIKCQPFEMVLDVAKSGDLVYLDPPYFPISKTANFSAYQKNGFGKSEHEKLKSVFVELDKRNCFVMLSNSSCEFTETLFAGYRLKKVLASRMVNSKSSGRGSISEILVRNY